MRRIAAGATCEELEEDPRQQALLDRFLAASGFERQLAADLAALAAGSGGASWRARRLATLMLHRQALLIPRRDLVEHDFLFVLLDMKPGPGQPLARRLLSEGFTTLEPGGFVRQFHAWLARNRRVFRDLHGARTSAAALRAFAAASHSECRLPLARHLFSATEVVARIAGQCRTSRGVASLLHLAGSNAAAEAERALSRLPAYEAAIVSALREPSAIYWVADRTASRFNSLVAQPPSTVALVVRPPGSCVEIEIKRSGCRGPHLLMVIERRESDAQPYGRGLAGVSLLPPLAGDARQSSRLALIYRRVHGVEAPLGSMLALATVYGVPSGAGENHLLDHLSQPAAWGAGYAEMRRALAALVASCAPARPSWRTELTGDLGLTLRLLHHFQPGQCILSGTSALRLDRAALYLGAAGSAAAREHSGGFVGAGLAHGKFRHAQDLTDEMLDEVLGLYTPPRVPYRDQREYVAAALAVPANRRRANRIYAALMRDLGRLWGTLLAVRGYSQGESFVARNVGLKSCWEGGRWRVRIVCMDHDALHLPDPGDEVFRPDAALHAMELDEVYLLGRLRRPRQAPFGAAEFLARIYRVGGVAARAGRADLRRALARAYHRTQAAVRRDPELTALFHPEFVRRLGDWDAVARLLIATPPGTELGDEFAAAVHRLLAGSDCRRELNAEYLETARRRAGQIRRFGFLYRRGRSAAGATRQAGRQATAIPAVS